jgi:hypothetical protein
MPWPRVVLLGVALALLSVTPRARAAETIDPAERRLTEAERRTNAEAAWQRRDFDYSVGLLTGFTAGLLSIDERKADAPSPFLTFVVEQALSYRVLQAKTTGLGVTLVGRLSVIDYSDRTLTQTDLALGPELRLLTRLFRPTATWRFRVTGGYSLGFQGDHAGRAVVESYSTGTGPNVGTAIVATMAGPSIGGYIQFGTFHRFLHVDAQARLTDDPVVSATTRHDYVQHELLFGGGLLHRF